MDIAYKKHELDYELVRLLVELEFDPEIHSTIKINGIVFSYELHGD